MNSERLRQKQISSWLDGELSPEELASFEQKMRQDSELAVQLKANLKSYELIKGLPEIPAPGGFQERIRKARAEVVINSGTTVNSRGWRLVLTVAGATFLIGLFFQTTGIQQNMGPVAELDMPVSDKYAVVTSDSTHLHHDSSTTLPEFQFTPVSGH